MRKKVSYYCTDENALRKMLVDADVFDWSTYFLIGGQFIYRWMSTVYTVYIYIYPFYRAGLDMAHTSMVKEVSSQRKVNTRTFTVVHLMYLIDSHHLLPEQEVPRYDPKAPGVLWSHLPQEFYT